MNGPESLSDLAPRIQHNNAQRLPTKVVPPLPAPRPPCLPRRHCRALPHPRLRLGSNDQLLVDDGRVFR